MKASKFKKCRVEKIYFEPCPGCGSRDAHITESSVPGYFHAYCNHCWVYSTYSYATIKEVVQAWNDSSRRRKAGKYLPVNI